MCLLFVTGRKKKSTFYEFLITLNQALSSQIVEYMCLAPLRCNSIKYDRKNYWRHISDEAFNCSRRVTFQLDEQKWPLYQSQLGSGPAALKRLLQLYSSLQVGILSKDMKSWRRYSLHLSPRSKRRSLSVGQWWRKVQWWIKVHI